MDFKFDSHWLFSEKQNILLQHMHKKNFGSWLINVEIILNTKTRLWSHDFPGLRPGKHWNSRENKTHYFQREHTVSVYYSTETDCLLRRIRKDLREIFNHLLCRKKKCCSTGTLSERVWAHLNHRPPDLQTNVLPLSCAPWSHFLRSKMWSSK